MALVNFPFTSLTNLSTTPPTTVQPPPIPPSDSSTFLTQFFTSFLQLQAQQMTAEPAKPLIAQPEKPLSNTKKRKISSHPSSSTNTSGVLDTITPLANSRTNLLLSIQSEQLAEKKEKLMSKEVALAAALAEKEQLQESHKKQVSMIQKERNDLAEENNRLAQQLQKVKEMSAKKITELANAVKKANALTKTYEKKLNETTALYLFKSSALFSDLLVTKEQNLVLLLQTQLLAQELENLKKNPSTPVAPAQASTEANH